MKKTVALLLVLVLCLAAFGAQAENVKRVYRAGEKEDFAEDEATFQLHVCPLLGADCMILQCGGFTMLCDMGKANDYPVIKEQLEALGVERIDLAYNTHPHDDHLGSMIQILQDYPVDLFMTVFPVDYTGPDVIQVKTVKALQEAGVPVLIVHDGYTFPFGGAKMEVICQTKYENPNPMSAMLRIKYGDCSALLCADLIAAAQLYVAQTHDLKADLFKFPHHGLNSVYREFLENIDPEYCFFTHSYYNTPEAREQLDQYGIPHDFATWGPIHLETNGQYWLVDQELNEDGQRMAVKTGRIAE